MRGPIDYIIVGFKGNKFDGSILASVEQAVNEGSIALLAMSGIVKGADGTVTSLNIVDMGGDSIISFTEKHPTNKDIVTQDDIDEVGDLLEPNTAAGFLVVEQLWAKPLKKAIIDAGGFLIADGRIHPDAEKELNEEGDN